MGDPSDQVPLFRRHGGNAAALLVVAGAAWLIAMIIPLTSGAFWPIVPVLDVLRDHAVRFADDPASVLPLRGDTWVLQPWIPALAQRAAWKIGGVTGLVLLQGALAVALAVLVYRIARAYARPVGTTIATLCLVMMVQPSALRTEQFALVIGAGLVLVLRGRAWWLAPALVALWANIHGSFVFGFALACAGALGMFRTPLTGTSLHVLRARLAGRVALLAATIVAMLATPLGVGIFAYVRSVRTVTRIDELTPVWGGMDPLGVRALLVYAMLVPVLAVRLPELSRRPRPRPGAGWLPVVPALVLLAATFASVRYASWFALAVLPELASALETLMQRFGGALRPWAVRTSTAIVLVFLAIGIALVVPGTHRQRTFADVGLPSARLLNIVDRDDVVLASAEWADYVHLRTGARIVVDARLERYRPADLREYLDFVKRADDQLVRSSGAAVVLLHHRTLGPGWRDTRRDVSLETVRLDHVAHDPRGDAFRVVAPASTNVSEGP